MENRVRIFVRLVPAGEILPAFAVLKFIYNLKKTIDFLHYKKYNAIKGLQKVR